MKQSTLKEEEERESSREREAEAERGSSHSVKFSNSSCEDTSSDIISWAQLKRVAKVIFVPAVSVNVTFLITISVFPALIVRLRSAHACQEPEKRMYNDLFTPIMFLLFNLFDFLGRLAAEARIVCLNSQNIWIPSLLRVIFIPLFLCCNISDSPTIPVLFKNSDAVPYFIMIFFGFSNGYIASAGMMLGSAVADTHLAVTDSSLAGTLMIFSLTFGLCLGAMASFFIAYISS
jgi:equilibrative nucleoside transporter 1/2/3